MSFSFFQGQRFQQHEVDNKIKQASEEILDQEVHENALEHMNEEERARFIESLATDRQARIEAEQKLRKRSDLMAYISIALGAISIFIGIIGEDVGSFLGWIAIVLGLAGIGFLVKYATSSDGNRVGWRGILAFFLSIRGISEGFILLVGAAYNVY